jgi:fatty acid desaturase
MSMSLTVWSLAAIVNRPAIDANHFTELGYYGLHTLHHMFPTLDHTVLPELQQELSETCKKFSIEIQKSAIISCFTNQFKQLVRTDTIRIR